MNPTVYFADKTLRVRLLRIRCGGVSVAAECGPNRDKILKILETHNSVSVVAADPGPPSGLSPPDSSRSRRPGAWW